MATNTYLVTATESARERLDDLAARLCDEGFEVSLQLEAIGVIVGLADESTLSSLRAVEGVQAIEQEGTVTALSPDNEPPT